MPAARFLFASFSGRACTLGLLALGLLCGPVTPALARNQIHIVGSSTVYPFVTAVAEQYKRTFPRQKAPIVESTGTGGGIKLFCAGLGPATADIVNASRRMKASEAALCAKAGVTAIIEIKLGLDGIVVAQSKQGQPFALTQAQLYQALAATPLGRRQTSRRWRDVDATLPNQPIEVLGPPSTSGTRDAFNELVLEAGCNRFPAMKALKKTDDKRHKALCQSVRGDGPFIEAGENDNLIVQKLLGNPQALGVFGYSFLEENADRLRALPINGQQPSYASITSGQYQAARDLYVYVKAAHVAFIPGLRDFMLELTKEGTVGDNGTLSRRGMIPLPLDQRRASAHVARALVLLNLERLP